MSLVDTMVPLLCRSWVARDGQIMPVTPLPPLSREAVSNLDSHWTGVVTPQMRQVLQLSCGVSGTPVGDLDFTGRWYPEEPLPIFRPSLTLSIDEKGRRWIAEVHEDRGLPGPVWCVLPQPEVAMFVDRTIADFLLRLHREMRRDTLSQWLTMLNVRARTLWATRHARAVALPVAFTRLRELRGWLACLPVNAWIYDLRAPGLKRGLPYGLVRERGAVCRCGSLPVFAFVGAERSTPAAVDGKISKTASESRVNGVAPGPIWTPLQISGRASEQKYQHFGSTAPLGRPVQLAANDASFTTGNIYGAGGGQGQP
jgi:hypothetical protein